MLPTHPFPTLRAAFLGIAALFVAFGTISAWRGEQIREQSRSLVADTLRRVELESRMARDVDRERLLIDAHIFQREDVDMVATERQLGDVEADLGTALGAFERGAGNGAPRQVLWHQLRGELTAAYQPIATTLALSRLNRDPEAMASFDALQPRFATIERLFGRLIALDRAQADLTVERVDVIQRTAIALQVLLAVIGLGATALLGAWTLRVARERDATNQRYAAVLREQNRELDAFAGRVAHDLRGPLSTFKLGLSHQLSNSRIDAPVGEILHRAIARMSALIDDLLALSRLGHEARGGACDPAAIADQIREDLQSQLASGTDSLHIDVPHDEVTCRDTLLRQVLWNLVENGVKYRREDAPLRLAIDGVVRGANYELCVTDNGVGMSPDEARQVFEPFYRAPNVGNVPGTGLGLSIVKRIIDAAGGTISVASERGRGTTFTLVLPRAQGGPHAAAW